MAQLKGANSSLSSPQSNADLERNRAANERTPLIQPNGHENGSTAGSGTQEDETTVINQKLPFRKLVIISLTVCMGVFLGAIDSTIIATLTAPISNDFHSLRLLSWLASAYLISNAVCQPISGRLTDIFGRGPGLIFSHVFFSAGNLICGFAANEYQMIVGRVVAGIGGGGLMSIATFVASDLAPLRKRGVAQGILNLFFGSGAILGGVIGGLFNDHTQLGWRLAFLIQAPPSLLAAVAVYFFVRIPPKQSSKSYLARIDFLGALLIASFLVLLLMGLNTGGNILPWTHPLPLAAIASSIVAFALFSWWESKAVQPIIPVRLLVDRTVLSACLSNFFCTMVQFSIMFYVPLYLQVRGFTATRVGLIILFAPLGSAISSFGAGIIMNKTGRYVALGIASGFVMLAGVIILQLHNQTTPSWLTALLFFLSGLGYASMLTTTLLACIAAVEHGQQAVITSATYLARSVGSALGVTISSAVYQNVLNAKLWEKFINYPGAAEEIARIRNDMSELQHLPEGWYEGAIQSFMEAFHAVFMTMLAMSIIALVYISLMKQHTLHSTMERDRR
ncbi:hypothetical protein FHL15_008596 [Xylaria flabelliformis]|uniref:Major facilitator superfamily (MFS) profile domain-containing protein n=1 Tax=Xylaria flabelliformis TaxID=2512241 RepID=A0A553HR50_9PEZI|nr:hypothetical protein FHL15_008596 [Xylaria flabelliformis]